MDALAPYRHFGLFREPFTLTPNRDLFFPDQHRQVLSAVGYAVKRGDGIVKVSGEVGTGKTLLCRMLIAGLEDDYAVAYISAPRNDPGAIAATICHDFGIALPDAANPMEVLGEFLIATRRRGRRAVLLIDEAQALDKRGLETVRLLTNFETDDEKLLTIILFGQPELDRILARHEMRQLSQRITFSFQTRAFDTGLAQRYLQHRIDLCTDAPRPHRIFAGGALRKLVKAARGVPRLLNALADRALLAAYAEGDSRIETRHVKAAMAEGYALPRRGLFGWWGGRRPA